MPAKKLMELDIVENDQNTAMKKANTKFGS